VFNKALEVLEKDLIREKTSQKILFQEGVPRGREVKRERKRC